MAWFEIPCEWVEAVEDQTPGPYVGMVGGSTAISDRDDSTYAWHHYHYDVSQGGLDDSRLDAIFPPTTLPDNVLGDRVYLILRWRPETTSGARIVSNYGTLPSLYGEYTGVISEGVFTNVVTGDTAWREEVLWLKNLTFAHVEAGQVNFPTFPYEPPGHDAPAMWLRNNTNGVAATEGTGVRISYAALAVPMQVDFGRFKVNVPTDAFLDPRGMVDGEVPTMWKFANPRAGENLGYGRMYVKVSDDPVKWVRGGLDAPS